MMFCSACGGVLVPAPEATVDHNPAKNAIACPTISEPDSSAHGRFLPGTNIAGQIWYIPGIGLYVPQATAMHDQRFKRLLQEFFAEFFSLFFPEWAARFNFAGLEWHDKELISDVQEAESRYVDILAKLPTREPVPAPDGRSTKLAGAGPCRG